MGLFPIAMNVLQFWLIDSIVKVKDTLTLSPTLEASSSSLAPDQEPLVFEADPDSDAEGDDGLLDPRRIRAASLSFDLESQSTHIPKSIAAGTTAMPEPKSLILTPESASAPSSAGSGSGSYSEPSPVPVVRRRSPPPSPSPTPSYVATENGDTVDPPVWEDWNHASSGDGNDNLNRGGGGGEGRASIENVPRRESWKMPVLSPPLGSSRQLS